LKRKNPRHAKIRARECYLPRSEETKVLRVESSSSGTGKESAVEGEKSEAKVKQQDAGQKRQFLGAIVT